MWDSQIETKKKKKKRGRFTYGGAFREEKDVQALRMDQKMPPHSLLRSRDLFVYSHTHTQNHQPKQRDSANFTLPFMVRRIFLTALSHSRRRRGGTPPILLLVVAASFLLERHTDTDT